MPQADIERILSEIAALRSVVNDYHLEIREHIAGEEQANKARDQKLQALAEDIWGRGGLKEQITGWKAVVAFVGFVCGAAGAWIEKLWRQ